MGWIIIITTVVVLAASIVISKNDKMPFEKKKIILLTCLGIYASLLIYQKLNEPKPDTTIVGLENQIYKVPSINSLKYGVQQQYNQIPDVNDYLDLLESNFDFRFDKKGKMGPVFALITGEEKTGKTYALQKFSDNLINNQISSVLYIDLKDQDDQQNIENLIKNINYQAFKKTFGGSFDAPPTLIIDHFEIVAQGEYSYTGQLPKCYICLTLKQLYIDYNVNILISTNSPISKKIIDISGVGKYVLKKQFSRTQQQEQILIKNIAKQIDNPELQKKIQAKHMNFCYQYQNFRFDTFNEFLNDWNSFESYQTFCENKIQQYGKKYILNEETKKIGEILVKLQQQGEKIVKDDNTEQYTFKNSWISYGSLKFHLDNDYKVLDQAISQGLEYNLFEQRPGELRFFNKLSQSSAIINLMYQKL